MRKLLSTIVILFSLQLNMTGQNNKPVFLFDNESHQYGFKSSKDDKEWLGLPIYCEGEDFGERDYTIVKRVSVFIDGYNILNTQLSEILPEYSEIKPQVCEGLIVTMNNGVYRLSDFDGNTLMTADYIELLTSIQNRYASFTKVRKEYLIGLSIKKSGSAKYVFYNCNLEPSEELVSDNPIACQGGALLFTNSKGGFICNAEGKVVSNYDGIPHLISANQCYHPVLNVMELENLYDGIMPAFVIVTPLNKMDEGRGYIGDMDVAVKKKITNFKDLNKDWTKALMKPLYRSDIIDYYKKTFIEPLKTVAEKNATLLEKYSNNPSVRNTEIYETDGEYYFSNDGGKHTVNENPNKYDLIEELGFNNLYVCYKKGHATLVTNSGVILGNIEGAQDYIPINVDKGYVICITDKGKILFDSQYRYVDHNVYDDIYYEETPGGSVFYFTIDGKWRAWTPKAKYGTTYMRLFDYVGEMSASGDIEVFREGLKGEYNLFNGTYKSPLNVSYEKITSERGISDNERFDEYQKIVDLDKKYREGVSAACYNKMGEILEKNGDENALDYYEASKNLGDSNGEENYKRLRSELRWDNVNRIMSSLAESLSQFSSAYNADVPEGMSYQESYDDSSTTGGKSSGSVSPDYYKRQYSNWERRAKSAYESLTNLGSRTKVNGKESKGSTGQSMSSSNYTRQKKVLRDAQSEMRKIRQDARKAGVTINESHWESVSVSY